MRVCDSAPRCAPVISACEVNRRRTVECRSTGFLPRSCTNQITVPLHLEKMMLPTTSTCAGRHSTKFQGCQSARSCIGSNVHRNSLPCIDLHLSQRYDLRRMPGRPMSPVSASASNSVVTMAQAASTLTVSQQTSKGECKSLQTIKDIRSRLEQIKLNNVDRDSVLSDRPCVVE